MNRREFVSCAALTGAVVAPAASGTVLGTGDRLRCRCTPIDGPELEAGEDRHAPSGYRLDLLGPADELSDHDRPGFGLKAMYAGLLNSHEFVLVHPDKGELSRGCSLHFARGSLAGLEVRWAGRRAFVAAAELFGHRRRPGRYRLEVQGGDGDRVSLDLRLVAA